MPFLSLFPHYSTRPHLKSRAIPFETLQRVFISPWPSRRKSYIPAGYCPVTSATAGPLWRDGFSSVKRMWSLYFSVREGHFRCKSNYVVWGSHQWMPSKHNKSLEGCSKINRLVAVAFPLHKRDAISDRMGHFQQSQTKPISRENIL